MSKSKFSFILGMFLATAAMCLFGAIVGSAPAPEDEPIPDELTAEPAKATKEEAAEHVNKSENNLRRIALAFHLYHDTFGAFPHNIKDKDGKVLLSWRVAILPYLKQDELFKQFKLEEPWNSEDNKKLLGKMPDGMN